MLSDLERLAAVMNKHNFIDAASRIGYAGVNVTQALNAWRDYPRCMDQYPMQLSSFRGKGYS